MLSGDNGILQKATDAKTNTENAQIKERIQLAELSARTDGKGSLAYSKLNEELTKEFGAKGTGYTISDEDAEIWTIKVGNVEYNIVNSIPSTPKTIISFTIDDAPYEAYEGMTFGEWVEENPSSHWGINTENTPPNVWYWFTTSPVWSNEGGTCYFDTIIVNGRRYYANQD